MRNIRRLLKNIRLKYRFSVRNQHTDSEVWYVHISPLNLLAGFLALILILFILVASTVAYTPILDFLPGYPGNKSREMLINGIMRLDSLEQELSNMQVYNENISLIMSGKNPVTRDEVRGVDSTKPKGITLGKLMEDSVLRAQFESEDSPYSIQHTEETRRQLRTSLELFAPVKGVIVNKFDPSENRYGIGIGTTVNQQVMAILDGTVISSAWTPSYGYVLYIQHPDNMLSIYRNNTSVLKKAGDRVRSGEIIGYTGTADENGTGNKNIFEFELWHNGGPVDPQSYIVF